MEKDLIKINLSEAQGQLQDIIKKVAKDDYDLFEFELAIQHVITHINTAYNIRDWDKARIDAEYEKSFDVLRKLPDNKYLID